MGENSQCASLETLADCSWELWRSFLEEFF